MSLAAQDRLSGWTCWLAILKLKHLVDGCCTPLLSYRLCNCREGHIGVAECTAHGRLDTLQQLLE